MAELDFCRMFLYHEYFLHIGLPLEVHSLDSGSTCFRYNILHLWVVARYRFSDQLFCNFLSFFLNIDAASNRLLLLESLNK